MYKHMTETGTTPSSRTPSRRWGFAVMLIALIAIMHGAFGWLYATSLSPQAPRQPLSASGEAYLQTAPGWNTDSEQDAAGFNRAALSILHRGLPYSRQGTLIFRTAVYSYFIAGCYAIGGLRLLSILVGQAILSGITGWMLTVAAGGLFGARPAVRLIVAVLYLLNLRIAMYAGYVMPLIPAVFFTAVALWAVTRLTERRAALWLVASLVLGSYTSSTFFVVALAGALWLILRRRSIAGAAVIGLFVALKFVITWSDVAGTATEANRAADRGGIFWMSNNPYYDRMRPWSLWEWRPSNPWSTWTMSDQERVDHEAYLVRAGHNELRATLLWIRENPGHYAQVCLARLRTEFGPYTGEMSPRNRLISTVIWLLVFPAGFYGLWRWRHHAMGRFSGLMVIMVFAFATFVTEEPYLRYRMPVDLLLTLFAGAAYSDWLSRFCRTNPSNAVTPS